LFLFVDASGVAQRPVSVTPVDGKAGGHGIVMPEKHRATQALLKDLSGYTGKEFHLIANKTTTISRRAGTSDMTDNTLIIRKSVVGRNHALIYYRDRCYWVIDLGSVNGTYVNNKRISSHRLLECGDIVRFVRYEFEFINSRGLVLSA
jgi:pSer/pThr/pTyr-binding forkhead associated (FHA) protein